MRILMTTAEPSVNNPTTIMAALILNAIETMADSKAPKAYPESLHKRKVPILSALCFGLVSWAMATRNVGYTIAVPTPRVTESRICH